MKYLLITFSAFLVLFTGVACGKEPSVNPPQKERFHLYLLIGQSNMAGRGSLLENNAVSTDRILKFSKENTWVPAVEPLHFDKDCAGAGLGASFARVMADASPGVTVGLIPCAVGGTPLSRWSKGGDLYKAALKRAQLAMKDGTLKGILWHQGEADAGSAEDAHSYGERLARMITDLRADLGAGNVPFVAGKLGEYLKKYAPVVNEQIAALPQHVARVAVVESNGLKHKGDYLHFDTPALREFGKRYAEAMQRVQKQEQ